MHDCVGRTESPLQTHGKRFQNSVFFLLPLWMVWCKNNLRHGSWQAFAESYLRLVLHAELLILPFNFTMEVKVDEVKKSRVNGDNELKHLEPLLFELVIYDFKKNKSILPFKIVTSSESLYYPKVKPGNGDPNNHLPCSSICDSVMGWYPYSNYRKYLRITKKYLYYHVKK